MVAKTWDEAIEEYSLCANESYRQGFYSGWFDCFVGRGQSDVALMSKWDRYSTGYNDGYNACMRNSYS